MFLTQASSYKVYVAKAAMNMGHVKAKMRYVSVVSALPAVKDGVEKQTEVPLGTNLIRFKEINFTLGVCYVQNLYFAVGSSYVEPELSSCLQSQQTQ